MFSLQKKAVTKKPKPAASKVKSKFASFRANLKKQKQESETGSEDTKTFEAGFFKVSSPVKSPALRNKCEFDLLLTSQITSW